MKRIVTRSKTNIRNGIVWDTKFLTHFLVKKVVLAVAENPIK